MGYKRDKIFKVTWGPEEVLGVPAGEERLVVCVRPTSLHNYMDICDIIEGVLPEQHETPEAAMAWMHEEFVNCLVSWNAENHKNEPVEPTLDGLLSLDMEMINDMIVQWIKASRSVGRPLNKPSTSGERSVAALVPMVPLSASPAS